MKNHFITLDVEGQEELEAREILKEIEELDIFGKYDAELCDTCTKKDDCTLPELGESVGECSDYGAPN